MYITSVQARKSAAISEKAILVQFFCFSFIFAQYQFGNLHVGPRTKSECKSLPNKNNNTRHPITVSITYVDCFMQLNAKGNYKLGKID